MAPAYLSQSDLEDVIGAAMVLRLFDDDGDGVADASAVERILVNAERYVGGYVSREYSMATLLASETATDHLRSLAVHIAAEYAFRRRTEFVMRDGTPYHGHYEETVKTLKDIGAGKCRVDIDGVPQVPANSTGLLTVPTTVETDGICPGTFTGGFGDF